MKSFFTFDSRIFSLKIDFHHIYKKYFSQEIQTTNKNTDKILSIKITLNLHYLHVEK